MKRSCLAFACAILALGNSAVAADAPPNVATCVAANERAIDASKAHHLRAAREQALICADSSCPGEVREECSRRVGEINGALPTIVFEVKDAFGNDLRAVAVHSDGALLMSEINGSALSLDPGEHTFVFDAAGSEPLTKTLMLREGEKDRRELITLRATPTHTPPPAELVTRKRSTAVRAVGVGLVGLGVVGVGLGTFFGLRARSSWSSSQAECSTARACTIGQHDQAVEDHDDASTMATLSTIAFAAGGVALAGGAVVFFAAPVVTPKSAGLSAVIRF